VTAPRVVTADGAGLAAAASALRAGLVVVIPTDTVYGLAVNPAVPGSVGRLFAAKGRPAELPVAVLVGSPEAGLDPSLVAQPVPPVARDLAIAHWPGALTFVLRRAEGFVADLGGDASTVGVRCPAHDWARELCRAVGPLATTSANAHGRATRPTARGAAREVTGREIGLVVDGGRCAGLASTVVDLTVDPPRLLRAGAVRPDL